MSLEDKLRWFLRKGDSNDVRNVCEEIFAKYQRLVFFVSYRILDNQEDAEDATQEAFVSVFLLVLVLLPLSSYLLPLLWVLSKEPAEIVKDFAS